MDIAPLGFSVDTKPLESAQLQADKTAASLLSVADATERLNKMTPGQQFGNIADAIGKAAWTAEKYNKELVLTNSLEQQHATTTDKRRASIALANKEIDAGTIATGKFTAEQVKAAGGWAAFEEKVLKAGKSVKEIAKENAALDKDMRTLATTLDPVNKKLLALGDVMKANERLFAAGRIGPQQYKKSLDELWASMQRIQHEADKPPPAPKAPGGGFFANILRRVSTAVPGFAAVGTQAVNAGVGGASLGGIAGLAAGGAIGLGGALVLREVMQLPEKFAEAEDNLTSLQRRVNNFSVGGFAEIEHIADRTGTNLKEAAKGLIEFQSGFERFAANTERSRALFETALAAGRISGMDPNERLQSAQTLAGIVESNRVTPGQLRTLGQQNPALLQAAASNAGGVEALKFQAATGQLTGTAFAELIERETASLKERNNRMVKTAAELREETNREWEKVMASFGGGLEKWFLQLKLDVARLLTGQSGIGGVPQPSAGSSAALGALGALGVPGLVALGTGYTFGAMAGAQPQQGSRSVSVPLGPATANPLIGQLAAAGAVGSQYGNYQTRQSQMQDDLTLLNTAIGGAEKQWKTLNEEQRKGVERLKEYRRELQAQMREQDTPFSKLQQDITDLTTAMGHGSGGLLTIWQQALTIQREQEKLGHGQVATLDAIVAKLKERAMLEAQVDLRNRQGNLAIQEGALAALSAAGPSGDKLLLEATTEAQTMAFQRFGDSVKSNDAIVKAYTDTLYRLKLVQRDMADETQAQALKLQIGDLQATMSARAGGASAADLALLQAQQRRQRAIQERMTTAMPGTAPTTMQVPGTTSVNVGPASEQRVIDTIRWLESRNRDFNANGSPMRSSAGAMFSMQVMPSTAARPGYGIDAASSQTPSEYNRVGESLVRALMRKYDGDVAKVLAAYHSGPGNVGDLGPEGRAYVANGLNRLGMASGTSAASQTVTIPGMPARAGGLSPQATAAIEAQFQLDMQNFRDQSLSRVLGMEDSNQRNRGLARTDSGGIIDTGLLQAMRENDQLSIRASELELKVWEARRQAAPEDRDRAEQAVRDAEASNTERAAAGIVGSQMQQSRDLKEQASLLQYNGDELKRQQALYETRQKLLAAGIPIMSAEGQQIMANTAALTEQVIAYERMAQLKDNARQTAEDIGDAFRGAMRRAAIDGEFGWKEAIRGIEMAFYDMLDRVMQQMVISPLINALTGILNTGLQALFGGMSGGSMGALSGPQGAIGMANGGVAGPDGLVSYASGGYGVMNTPTRLMFGNQRALAGEGPGLYEALLPLRRGPNGQLGVQAHGGSDGGGGSRTQVNIIDQRGSGGEPIEVQERETGDGMRQLDILVRDSVKAHTRRGSFDADNRAAFGISRTTTRR